MSTTQTVPSDPGAAPTSPGRHRRRIILYSLLLVVVVIFVGVLWAVGALARRPKLVMVTSSQDPYWDLVIRGAEDAAKRFNANLTVIRAKSDEEAQTAELERLAGQGYDGIAVSPINPGGQTAVLAQLAHETKLVTFDSDSPVLNRLCFVGTDNYMAGHTCAEQVRSAVPDGGEVLVSVGSIEKENGQRRRQGLIDELLERSYDPQRATDPAGEPIKGAKYMIVTIIDGLDSEKATAMATEAIKSRPSTKCVVGLFAYSTPALLKALEQTGKLGEIRVVGFDVNEPTLAGVESGTVYATIMQDQYGCGYDSVRILADSARGLRYGLPIFQSKMLSCEPVTKQNLAQIREEMANPSVRP